MKTLNIFAILFIVSIVNTTKVSYSDVASSLLQLHDTPADALTNLQALQESFQSSHQNLDQVSSINTETCRRLVAANTAVLGALNNRINNANNTIAEKQNGIGLSQQAIKDALAAQAAQGKKVQEAEHEIEQQHTVFVRREAELGETVNVLQRLKNIAQDELAGKTQIHTEMGKYNVVNNHGVSFIQRSNMKQELRNIMGKSETVAKSLISSLILMTLSDDAHYSDPAIVRRIIAVLDKIIAKNVGRVNTLKQELEQNTQTNSQIVANGAEIIANLEESKIKAQFTIELDNREILMLRREIEMLERSVSRRQGRAQFQADYCRRQNEMMDQYQKRYAEVATRVNEMRAEFNGN